MPLRIAQTCLLILWAAFFLWLLSAGQEHLARLLHPRLWWLVVAGLAIVCVFLLVNLGRLCKTTLQPKTAIPVMPCSPAIA